MRISDWSSDVCSSDLLFLTLRKLETRLLGLASELDFVDLEDLRGFLHLLRIVVASVVQLLLEVAEADRKSVVSGKSVSVRVDLGGRRLIKQIKSTHSLITHIIYYLF